MRSSGVLLLAFLVAGCTVQDPFYPPLSPPPVPVQVFAQSRDNFVDVFWDPVFNPDLAGYRVYVAPAYGGPYTVIGTAAGTAFRDIGARNGFTYFYAVTSIDRFGGESPYSVEEAVAVPRPEGYNVRIDDFRTFPLTSGFDFSRVRVVPFSDPTCDIYLDYFDGTLYMVVYDDTDIQGMGPTLSIADVNLAPSTGWSTTRDVVLFPGHTYVVWTKDGNFAKFRVSALTPSSVMFDWAYQTIPNIRILKPPAEGHRTLVPKER